ncbi:hypothetical protein [Agarivorans sp. QJM3NY_25]|uniref:hypothetical protein n=1 Tax=Agarivorans sp. QJM3NY_25 TaxID=3421430 RepID=UPI003D7E7FD0
MAVYVQTKIRLKYETNKLLKKYQELNDMTQSKIIEKALTNLFTEDKEFVEYAEIDVSNKHWNLTVAEIEDIVFDKYKIMIYIHAEQDENIGVDLSPWPKCMSKYTLKDFTDKIIRRCLAKEVNISVFDHKAQECKPNKIIKNLKKDCEKIVDRQQYYDLWELFDEGN